jgi:putative phosphoesterase
MRTGLIADIHGNLFALRAVLAELDRLGADRVVCLGDVATPGPWPAETIALLMERGIQTVRGNTDEWLLARNPTAVSDTPVMNALNTWAAARLGPGSASWLRGLPMRRQVDVAGRALALCHGSPRSTTEVISAVTPPDEVAAMLNGVEATILAGGHTHVQLLRNTGDTVLVNPGSVGLGGVGPGTPDLPLSQPATGAEFAVIEGTSDRSSVSFHQLPLDIEAMIAVARRTGMPHHDWWASLWAIP